MFKNILIATDFSDHSILARKMAIALAKGKDKRLKVLHVYDLHQKLLDEGVLLASEVVETAEKKRIQREAKENLDAFCEPIRRMEINYDQEIREGKAAKTIVEAAKELDTDLIVIGSHSKRGFVDVSLGGVTRRVGENAPCPVLIVTDYKEDGEEESTEKKPEVKPAEEKAEKTDKEEKTEEKKEEPEAEEEKPEKAEAADETKKLTQEEEEKPEKEEETEEDKGKKEGDEDA